MLTLLYNRSRSSQAHDLYKLCRAPLPMLHAKFQNHRPSGSEEEDFQRFLLFIAMAAILSCDLNHLY